MFSIKNLICCTNSFSVMLWYFVDAMLDQYVVPLFFITKYFSPLILYASWGMFVYRVEKSKLSNCLALFVLFSFFEFL